MSISNFLDLVNQRYSCRNYNNREIPDSVIENCLNAARVAPSACNKQPWRFVIIKSEETRKAIFEKGLLPGLPMPWFKTAPVIVAMCAESKLLTHKIAPMISGIDYRLVDLGIAGEHFVLAAEAQGVGSCWIGWFKEKTVKKILQIPRNIKIVSLLTLGYAAEERPPAREKLNLKDITHYERWQ